jgi:isoamylase
VYCHDGLSRMDWKQVRDNQALLLFFRRLIAFRNAHRSLRRASFVPEPGAPAIHMHWHGAKQGQPDWGWESRSLALHTFETESEAIRESIYLITNAHWEASQFELPQVSGQRWARFLDTSLTAPNDITELGEELGLIDQRFYATAPRSTVVLVGKPERY